MDDLKNQHIVVVLMLLANFVLLRPKRTHHSGMQLDYVADCMGHTELVPKQDYFELVL